MADLRKQGATALTDEQLKTLLVGHFIWVRNNVTGVRFKNQYTIEGQTITYNVGRTALLPSEVGNVQRAGYLGTSSAYSIHDGKLTTWLQHPFDISVYKLGDRYLGARSNEFGYANYEIIKAPQVAGNPVAEKLNQLSLELSLTEQQRQQIVPFVKEEIRKLEALKTNTSLSKEKKVEELREIGRTIDGKITPLLNPEQQAKYKQMQEERRRKMIEKMGNEAIEKAEEEIRKVW